MLNKTTIVGLSLLISGAASATQMLNHPSTLTCDGNYSANKYAISYIASNADYIDTTGLVGDAQAYAAGKKTLIGRVVLANGANTAASTIEVGNETVNLLRDQARNTMNLVPDVLNAVGTGELNEVHEIAFTRGAQVFKITFRATAGLSETIFSVYADEDGGTKGLVPNISENTLGALADFLDDDGEGWTWMAKVVDTANQTVQFVSGLTGEVLMSVSGVGIVATHETACLLIDIGDVLLVDTAETFYKGGKTIVKGVGKAVQAVLDAGVESTNDRIDR